MAHYALLDVNNVVTQVITGKDEDEQKDGVDVNWENEYKDIHSAADRKRTSFNTDANTHRLDGTPFRGNYAAIGYTYDVDNDIFIGPKPHADWVLDTNTSSWVAPVDMPDDGKEYDWDETTSSWVDYPA